MSIDSLAHTDSLELLAAFHTAAEEAMYEWQAEQAAEYFSSLLEKESWQTPKNLPQFSRNNKPQTTKQNDH